MNATSDNSQAHERSVSIGGYRPPDAERLLAALTSAQIKFEIECDDGIDGSMSKFGSFGSQARIRIFVERDQIPRVTQIQRTLFGE